MSEKDEVGSGLRRAWGEAEGVREGEAEAVARGLGVRLMVSPASLTLTIKLKPLRVLTGRVCSTKPGETRRRV